MANVSCPICEITMKTETYEGVSIDVCSKHGTWLDYGELKRIVRTREIEFDGNFIVDLNRSTPLQGEMARALSCPICRHAMPPVNYQGTSGIVINTCDNDHGVWLDHGELDKVQIVMERWEEKVKSDPNKYSDLAQHVKASQEIRLAATLEELRPSSFEFINAIIRRVIKFVE